MDDRPLWKILNDRNGSIVTVGERLLWGGFAALGIGKKYVARILKRPTEWFEQLELFIGAGLASRVKLRQ